MGLISGIVGLPLAPLRGVVAVAEQVRQQAEKDFYDPQRIRDELAEVDRLRESGQISEDEATAWEDQLVDRLMNAPRSAKEQ